MIFLKFYYKVVGVGIPLAYPINKESEGLIMVKVKIFKDGYLIAVENITTEEVKKYTIAGFTLATVK